MRQLKNSAGKDLKAIGGRNSRREVWRAILKLGAASGRNQDERDRLASAAKVGLTVNGRRCSSGVQLSFSTVATA
jgi:hypothetical protein